MPFPCRRRFAPFAIPALAGLLAAQQPLPRDVLQGTVTDAAGAPVANATLEVHRRDAQGFHCLDLVHSRATQRVQVLRAGKNGTFATQLPRGVPFELHVDDGVHAPIVRREVYAGEQVALQVVDAAHVTLVLRDQAGKPCPGGRLEAWDAEHVRWADGAIDREGRWASDRLPPGPLLLDIAPAVAQRPEWRTVELEAGVTTPVEFVLEPGCTLRGRVTDKATGQPIAGARIGEGWTMDKFVESDADGRYEMAGYGAPGYGNVRVTAAGYGPQLRLVKRDDAGVPADFALEPGFEVRGRITDATGKPVAGAYVAAVGGGFSSSSGTTHDWSSATTGPDGTYLLRGLRLQHAHGLLVRFDGAATLVFDLPEPTHGTLALPDIALRTARYVTGLVETPDGAPRPGVTVALNGCNSDRPTKLGASRHDPSADYCIAVRSMRTDSLGRIHFADVPPGTYVLRVEAPGADGTVTIEVPEGRDPDPVRIQL